MGRSLNTAGARFCGVLVLLLACAAIAFFLLLFFRPHLVRAASLTEVWSIDLGADSDFHKRLSVEEVLLDPPSVDFLNNTQIICAFYGGAEVGTGDPASASGYHVLEINAHTGALGRKLDFKAFEDNYRALPVADGGFVVLAGDALTKFNDQFTPGPNYATPAVQAGETYDHWLLDVSPSGQTAMLYRHRPEEDRGTLTWLRTTDLFVAKNAEVPRTPAIRASDNSGIFVSADQEKLLSPSGTSNLCSRCKAHFLTDGLLFLDKENAYAIETIAGESRGSGDLDVGGGDFTRAVQATRFAYATGHYIGSGFPIQTHFNSLTSKIMVLDWSTNKAIVEIDVNEPAGNPSAGLSQMALALSPDGKYLAVLLHHTLSLYRLP